MSSKDTLTIKDNRTDKSYEIAITNDCIRANDLRQIKVNAGDFGMMSYDPAYLNTASCISNITYLDGEKGILRYRGYPIEQLAEKSNYLESAYLLTKGELPNKSQLAEWTQNIQAHSKVKESVKLLLKGFEKNGHPMGILGALFAALSTYYPDAKKIGDAESRQIQTYRIIGQITTLAAYAYRYSRDLPYIESNPELSYGANFLNMLFNKGAHYKVHPVLEKAIDLLFILHADHEQNCSTSAMRSVGSSHVDPFAAMAAAIAALYGPLHGGANEAVLKMLDLIGDKKNIPDFIKKVKAGEGKLMGFGHRVYKNYDPRAKIIKAMADQVFEVTGKNPHLEIALQLEKIALEDEYFIKRKLYPNVDFYSGLIYQSMGFPTPMFTVLFAIGRASGWMAQWDEMIRDQEQKISRPRQVYLGEQSRDYVDVAKR